VSEVVEAAGARVFADEIHAPFLYGDRRHVPYASVSEVAAAHSITGTSASKAWNLPGLKCAQAITTNHADAERWERLPRVAAHGTSNLGVVANAVAYRSGGEWLAEVLRYLDGSRHLLDDLLAEHVPGSRWRVPDATYMAWIDLRECGLGPCPADTLMERSQVAVNDGVLCGAGFEGHIRLNFATPRPILRTMVERIAAAGARSGEDGR
jgi:cystathionine beta-lyase